MSALSPKLDEYLALRRSLGYKLERAGQLLVEFVAYLPAVARSSCTLHACMLVA